MFERFTERARRAISLAHEEAVRLGHNYIGTEHLLLGLLREEEGMAARALESLGVAVDEVRDQIARIVGQGETATGGQLPFTPRAKKVLELSLRQALDLGHDYIGTEHILLAIEAEGEGVAARILLDFGADPDAIRARIQSLLGGPAVLPLATRPRRMPLPARAGLSLATPAPFAGPGLLVVGWSLFAAALAIGVLIGWAIWGH